MIQKKNYYVRTIALWFTPKLVSQSIKQTTPTHKVLRFVLSLTSASIAS